jgi:hypothetical protein
MRVIFIKWSSGKFGAGSPFSSGVVRVRHGVSKVRMTHDARRIWAVILGKEPRLRECLVWFKKPFSFFQELTFLPASTALGY